MNCPKCGGTGFVPTNVFGVNGAIKCDFCDGSGVFITNAVEPQTNFDWLTETPERLASWIENILIESGCEVTQCRETWIMWLKQPHTDKE